MYLADVLLPLLPRPEAGGVIALVGAGGKTSAMFGLTDDLARKGHDVLMTTTTHIFDPRPEQGGLLDQVVLDPTCAAPAEDGMGDGRSWAVASPLPGRGRRIVLAAREEPGLGKLQGIHPTRVAELRRTWAFVVVEADGAKRLPVKAPAAHEPALPAVADMILGVVGLDCLGRPMDGATVHRPERFGPISGCAPGAPIRLEHIASLARSPQGMFKGAPRRARRVLLLNKADRCAVAPSELLRGLQGLAPSCADLILVCSLADPRRDARVLAQSSASHGFSPE